MTALHVANLALWVTAAVFLVAYKREQRHSARLRRAICNCGQVTVVVFPRCVDVDGWHHGHGAGHCHPLEAVDL